MEPVLVILSVAGIAVFAVSGALLGLRKEMDVVGVSFVATVTGVGGGTIRDLLLGATPVAWVRDPRDIIVCLAGALLVCLFHKQLSGRRMQGLLYADAAGLALFAVLGASTALAADAHPLIAILFGAMSASFGGVIRDVMCNETPVLFSSELYVTPALLGATAFVVLPDSLDFEIRAAAGVTAALTLRLCAIRFGWSIPFPRYR